MMFVLMDTEFQRKDGLSVATHAKHTPKIGGRGIFTGITLAFIDAIPMVSTVNFPQTNPT